MLFPLINGIDITRRNRDGWVIDTGESMSEQDAALYEAPFQHIVLHVKPVRAQNNDRIRRTFWWRFGRNGEQLRAALKAIPRYINTPRVAKHRLFVWQQMPSIPDTATVAIARADDTTFGILHSRFHELWSLRMCTWLGVGNDPRYTPTTCFETFPFPAGLTPLDTAHQRTEAIAGGALIPAGLPGADFKPNQTTVGSHQAQAAINNIAIRDAASAIAQAAQRLDTLRRNWLNPPEWTQAVPEVVPLGLQHSPYPDRIEPRPGLSEPDAKALKARTLTNLYNQRPAWLAQAHAALDAAVAAAYGWADYTPATPDDEILRRLLQLNRERAAQAGGGKEAVS
ncbi:class I SAM-dependent DNA methyltransferase [Ottowia pentelensis]